jgi:hypothetical protein
MDRVECTAFELLRVGRRDDVVGVVERLPLGSRLKTARNSAMAVIVGKLRIGELRVELANLGAEFRVAPLPRTTAPSGLRSSATRISASVGYFCRFGHICGAAVS